MKEVILTGWNNGLKKISLTHLLKGKCCMSFTQAKLVVDALVDGITVKVTCEDPEGFVKEATELGAICKVSEVNYLVHA